MLRKRSRGVTSKQVIVGDQRNQQWITHEKHTQPISFLFNTTGIVKGFFTISSSSSSCDEEPIMSPTSILDTQPFSIPLWGENKTPTPKTLSPNTHIWDQPNNTKGIGLALVDEKYETNNPYSTKQHNQKLVILGSPREFGIKTPKSQIQMSPFGNLDCQVHNEESISISEIEESEDYTCVISHGPNPRTTHIFGNCIVGSCCGIDGSSSLSSRRNGYLSSSLKSSLPSQSHESFFSFCHHCKKKLGHGNDIYMYRGEKAFCSKECHCQEMLFGVKSHPAS